MDDGTPRIDHHPNRTIPAIPRSRPVLISLADYAANDAQGLMALLRRGEVTVDELRHCALAAIDALNPSLNFLVGRAEPSAVCPGADAPAFAGLPFLLKEGAGLRGQPSVMGSRLGAGLRATVDGELVVRLLRSGVCVLGSTNTPEFGSSPTTEPRLHGPARNPWNPQHSCGGSSGGAAAAVAAGVVPVAQGSDSGGSLRTPAHCCGVFGLKPSRGRTPLGPESNGGVFGLATQHVLTRSVRDAAAFLDVLAGDEPGALYRLGPPPTPGFREAMRADPGRLRIAFFTTSPSRMPIDSACQDAVLAAARLCAMLGHDVDEAAPPCDWDAFAPAFCDIWSLGMPATVQRIENATGRRAGPQTLERCNLLALEHARQLDAARIGASMHSLHRIAYDAERFAAAWDVVISPVDLTPAPRLGDIDADANYATFADWFDVAVSRFCPHTPLYNVTGQPAMSVPLALSEDGLPVGVQFAARVGDEVTLLRLAAQLEAAAPWAARVPPIHAGRIPCNLER